MAHSSLAEIRPLVPMYIHLIVSAMAPIYAGAHASLSRPSSAAKSDKRKKKGRPRSEDDESGEDDEEDDAEEHMMEGLSPRDAIIFPVTAGVTLAGLYWLIKTYGAKVINAILAWYFSAVGIFSVGQLINDGFIFVLGRRAKTIPKYRTILYIHEIIDLKATLTVLSVASAILGIASIVLANLFTVKAWWLTNLQGFAVCYSALQILSPTTFATGSLILSGLFFYDIWAVFFTPLMVTVAKNLDQPIKLVFPRPDEPSATPGEPPLKAYSMLGLGDIVLPGIMIGLALRFDLYMYYLRKQKTNVVDEGITSTASNIVKAPYVRSTGRWDTSFAKPYFTASMIGYLVGMLTTLGVMSVFNHAQPALLYLVPGVLISIWGMALVRGELRPMWDFTEAITGEQIDDDVQNANGKAPEERSRKGDGGSEKSQDKEKTGKEGSSLEDQRRRDTLIALSVVRRRRKTSLLEPMPAQGGEKEKAV
nr:signal peptide peptidase [Quercus suber]